jgi:hypothetical protein
VNSEGDNQDYVDVTTVESSGCGLSKGNEIISEKEKVI